jgi:hypothetical protein
MGWVVALLFFLAHVEMQGTRLLNTMTASHEVETLVNIYYIVTPQEHAS